MLAMASPMTPPLIRVWDVPRRCPMMVASPKRTHSARIARPTATAIDRANIHGSYRREGAICMAAMPV